MKTKLGATLLGFSYMTLGLIPAYADDTDIFLGRQHNNTVKPNVLFILDNSGSMADRVSGRSGPSRMQTLQESMISILSSVQGINAGFMRFNAPGGSILYPVSDLDAPLEQYWLLQSNIRDGHDDASQSLTGVSSTVTNESELTLGAVPTQLETRQFQIRSGTDDALQSGSRVRTNNTNTNNNRLELSRSRHNGFRFQNVDIPAGADIHEATIQFRSRSNASSDLSLIFHAESIADSPTFVAGSSNNNISNRSLTDSTVTWVLSPWNTGVDYTSPDLSALVQEVIDLPGWSSGNALSIIQTAEAESNSSNRRVESYETNSSRAARLEVQFQPPGGVYAPQQVGLRFENVSIPRGATITNAYIELTSSSNKSSDTPLELSIALEDSDNADSFENRSLVGTSTVSPAIDWVAGDWTQDETVQTPSLIEPLQNLVNDASWCGGNAVAFHITPKDLNTTLNRTFYSADYGGKAPRLVVEYDPNTVPQNSCNQVVLRFPVSERANDADERLTSGGWNNPTGTVDNNGHNLPLNSDRLVGLRFENLPLKQGAVITDARVIFTAGANGSGSASTTFKVQDSVAPPNFPENNRNISNRSLRADSVVWNLGNWTQNNRYRSPDLSSLIHSVVNKDAWNPLANGIVFVLSSTGSRDARSVDWGAGGAPVLEIKINVDHLEGGIAAGGTVRHHLMNIVGELESRTNTPIVDSLYEAALYFGGRPVHYAKERAVEPRLDNRRYQRVSHLDALLPGDWELVRPSGCTEDNLDSLNCRGEHISGSPVYKSPIEHSCQANYIVLLTDGQANSNYSAEKIKTLIGHSGSCQNSNSGEACSEELVEWMANNDLSDAVAGTNSVNTFTIAFAFDHAESLAYLQRLAQKGGGRFFRAGSEAELTNAFNTIIAEILDQSATFVVPGTTVSQFNRLAHHEDIYFSVFKPNARPRWAGNLKKYKISRTEANYGRIVGQQDRLAVDESTGFFKDNVASFWTPANDPDGPNVEKGGAAMLLKDPNQRTVVTFYEGASTDLTNTKNRLSHDNDNLTPEMLKITEKSGAYREELLRWARGEDVFDENLDGFTNDARRQFGDPLHSAPVVIDYGGTDGPNFSIFFGTNDGFLRAIDGETGQEHFAFIPESLLGNLQILFDNSASDPHPYGVDGDITRWVHDADGDPETPIGSQPDDHVYIYFGLRRGGSHYYALDVTDRSKPKLLWHIDGSESPFDELGQTWSQPVKARVSVKGDNDQIEIKDVLIFGGGYDPDQDDADMRQADSEGRAIFMVEAGPPKSGIRPELVWSAGPSESHTLRLNDMKYGIPSIVRAGDTNGDGLVDVMFAADMGGQIWRFDVNNGAPAHELVSGGVIAQLAEDGDAKAARRFYGGVDAATIVYRGERFIALTAGSGWRANPLNEVVEDRFYMIRQPTSKPTEYEKLTEADLYDATDISDTLGSDDPIERAEALEELIKDKSGWFIRLGKGEKVLAPSVTAQATVYFTTYQPGNDNENTNACSPSLGKSFLYAVNIIDSTPAFLNKSGELVRRDESTTGSISPTPTFIVLPDGTTRTLVGPEEKGETLFGDPTHKTYWYENQ